VDITRPAQLSAQPPAPSEKGSGRRRTSELPGTDLAEKLELVARDLTNADNADDVLDIFISRGLLDLNADGAMIVVIEQDKLVPVAARGYAHDALAAFFPASLDLELPVTVSARENRAVWVSNRSDAARRFPELGASPVARSNAWVAVPLAAAGVVFGVLGISFLEPHEFTRQERRYLGAQADLCALALRLASPTNDHTTTQGPTFSK
jgi:GAF domain-containing protein